MTLNYNLWSIDGATSSIARVWSKRMDWVYFAKDTF